MFNEIRTVTGHKGTPTNVLYSEVKKSGCCGTSGQGGGATQDPLHVMPATEPGDMYVSKWLMLQPDLLENLHAVPTNSWRVIFEWKEGGGVTGFEGGAFRAILSVVAHNGATPSWQVTWDNDANGGFPRQQFWRFDNFSIPVPIGKWFKLEVFWHRSGGSDGRVWFAVNGQVIDDHTGPTIGTPSNPIPVGRIMINQVYTGAPYPIYQWMDDVQIWRSFPTARAGDAWFDPPYAPH
jgi:hypothetical protein